MGLHRSRAAFSFLECLTTKRGRTPRSVAPLKRFYKRAAARAERRYTIDVDTEIADVTCSACGTQSCHFVDPKHCAEEQALQDKYARETMEFLMDVIDAERDDDIYDDGDDFEFESDRDRYGYEVDDSFYVDMAIEEGWL